MNYLIPQVDIRNYDQGVQNRLAFQDDQEKRTQANALRTLMPKAVAGDKNAFNEVTAIDPGMALQVQKVLEGKSAQELEQAKRGVEKIAQTVMGIEQLPPDQQAQAWAQFRQTLPPDSPAPQQWVPGQTGKQVAAQLMTVDQMVDRMLPEAQKPQGLTNVSPGGVVFDQDARKPIYTAPRAPTEAPREMWGAPQDESGPNGESIRVRYSSSGGRQVIPGAKPHVRAATGLPSEDERKSAFLLQRLQKAEKDMALYPDEMSPEIGAEIIRGLPLVPEAAANAVTSDNRQIVEGAQLDALDAALTLATGAAYTKEQLRNVAKSYFPQIGDSASTVKAKKSRYDNLIEAAKLRAGRAVPAEEEESPEEATQRPGADASTDDLVNFYLNQ